MTVTAAMPYRIRLTGPTSLVALTIGDDGEGFQFGDVVSSRSSDFTNQAFLRVCAASVVGFAFPITPHPAFFQLLLQTKGLA
jgi:hypothetical protein